MRRCPTRTGGGTFSLLNQVHVREFLNFKTFSSVVTPNEPFAVLAVNVCTASVAAPMPNLYRILALLIVMPAALAGADLRPVISREVGKFARAWEASDYHAILAYLPARVVQQSGGRAAVLVDLKNKFAQARELGANQLEAVPGQPSPPRQVGQWLASVLPLQAVLHGNHVAVTQETHVLALSSDRGKKWFFVLLYDVGQGELNTWFPEFRGKVVVPTSPAPRVNIVY